MVKTLRVLIIELILRLLIENTYTKGIFRDTYANKDIYTGDVFSIGEISYAKVVS